MSILNMLSSRRPEASIVRGVLALIVGFFVFFLRNEASWILRDVFALKEPFGSLFAGIVGALFILIGVGLLISYYLSYGARIQSLKFKDMDLEFGGDSTSSIVTETISDRISNLIKQLEEKVEKTTEEATAVGAGLTDEDRSEIVTYLKDSIDRELGSGLLGKIEETYGKIIVEKQQAVEYRRLYRLTMERLRSEIQALGRRGNLNLIIGTLTTVTGLFMLGYMVFSSSIDPKEPWSIAAYYIPRLSLILFIEIFAYFFLRLYKSSLQEIKYFQNELTNTELKLLAFEAAIESADSETVRNVLITLSKTERNFVLDKGQTTVELEKEKVEQSTMKEIVKALAGGLGSRKILGK